MTNEDLKIPTANNAGLKRYIITFKPKDQRQDKKTDKIEILKQLMGVVDFENYVNISVLRNGDKYHRYNKVDSTGRNGTDRFNL